MPTHPGHPALAATDTLSASRTTINDAIDAVSTQSVTATKTLDVDDGRYVLVSPAAATTITLPDPSADERHQYVRLVFKRLTAGASTVTVDVASSGSIDGASSVTLNSQYDTLIVFSTATAGAWYREN